MHCAHSFVLQAEPLVPGRCLFMAPQEVAGVSVPSTISDIFCFKVSTHLEKEHPQHPVFGGGQQCVKGRGDGKREEIAQRLFMKNGQKDEKDTSF